MLTLYRIDQGAADDHSWSWSLAASVFLDWKTYMYMFIYITGTSALQGVTLFLPSIVKEMGTWDNAISQLLTTPPYFAAFFATIGLSYSSGTVYKAEICIVKSLTSRLLQ